MMGGGAHQSAEAQKEERISALASGMGWQLSIYLLGNILAKAKQRSRFEPRQIRPKAQGGGYWFQTELNWQSRILHCSLSLD